MSELYVQTHLIENFIDGKKVSSFKYEWNKYKYRVGSRYLLKRYIYCHVYNIIISVYQNRSGNLVFPTRYLPTEP